MSVVMDINGNVTVREDKNADAWARRNRHRLTDATVDGQDHPLLMVHRDDGSCYRRRCMTLAGAWLHASRLGLVLNVSQGISMSVEMAKQAIAKAKGEAA